MQQVAMRWTCANCDEPLGQSVSLFCDAFCKKFAETIRRERRVSRDGRINDPLVAKELLIRRIQLWSGFAHVRRLSPMQRAEAFDVLGHNCVKCGAPATDIDHIVGSGSNDLENLQALCSPCHLDKTISSFTPLPFEPSDEAINYFVLKEEYERRAASDLPLRECDDEGTWGLIERPRRSERLRIAKAEGWHMTPAQRRRKLLRDTIEKIFDE
jgi:5-methylcytosine-specific restriction endonuclease McrA